MGQVIYLRRTRLYCGNCGARHSTVTHDKKTRTTTAVCDSTKGGCGGNIPLYKDVYGKYHPVKVEKKPEGA